MEYDKKKKVQFSKGLTVLTGLIFVCTLAYCLHMMHHEGLDFTVGVCAITTTGAIFSANVVWMLKKSQAENVIKERIQYATVMADKDFEIYKKKLELRKEMGLLHSDEAELEEAGKSIVSDEFEEAFNNDKAYMYGQFEGATEDPEINIM